MKDNWENWLNLKHTLDRMYLTSISEVQYLDILSISGECHKTTGMVNQYWFGQWLGAVRQQAVTLTNIDIDLFCDMATPGHNELTNRRLMAYICASKMDHQLSFQIMYCRLVGAKPLPEPTLTFYQFGPMHKIIAFENAVCNMSPISFMPQCVNNCLLFIKKNRIKRKYRGVH